MFKRILAVMSGKREIQQPQPAAPVTVEPRPVQPPTNLDEALEQLRSLIHHPENDRVASLLRSISFCESVLDVQMITKRINWPANRWSEDMQNIYGATLDAMCEKEFSAHFDSNSENRLEHLFWIAQQAASVSEQLRTRVCDELLRKIRSPKTIEAACNMLEVCKVIDDKFGLDVQYGRIARFHARALFRQELAKASTTKEGLSLRYAAHKFSFEFSDFTLATERVAQLCETIEEVTQTSKTMTGMHFSFLAKRATELCSTLDEAYVLWSESKIPDIRTQIVDKWDILATIAVADASSAEQLESVFLHCRADSPPALQAIEKMARIPR